MILSPDASGTRTCPPPESNQVLTFPVYSHHRASTIAIYQTCHFQVSYSLLANTRGPTLYQPQSHSLWLSIPPPHKNLFHYSDLLFDCTYSLTLSIQSSQMSHRLRFSSTPSQHLMCVLIFTRKNRTLVMPASIFLLQKSQRRSLTIIKTSYHHKITMYGSPSYDSPATSYHGSSFMRTIEISPPS